LFKTLLHIEIYCFQMPRILAIQAAEIRQTDERPLKTPAKAGCLFAHVFLFSGPADGLASPSYRMPFPGKFCKIKTNQYNPMGN
jgi:hypothetical protein